MSSDFALEVSASAGKFADGPGTPFGQIGICVCPGAGCHAAGWAKDILAVRSAAKKTEQVRMKVGSGLWIAKAAQR